jgi:carboxypeptidase family protein
MRRIALCALGVAALAALFGSTPSGQSPAPPRSPATPGGRRPARDNPVRAQAPPSSSGAIRGRVIAAGSGQPLVKARVSFSSDSGAHADPIFTDTNGVFAFPDLPAGHYTLSAEKTGFARARYGSKGPSDPPMEITVGGPGDPGGRVVQGLDIALIKGAAVLGRIVDELGDPIVGGIVSLGAVQAIGSELRLTPVARGTAETNDLGEYRIGDLLPGRYFVSIAGAGLGTMPSGMPREWERLKAWGRTFFPGTVSVVNATPVAIGTGEERGSVDFVVVPGGQPRLQMTITGGLASDSLRAAPAATTADSVRLNGNGIFNGVGVSVSTGGRGGGPFNTVTIVSADQTLGAAVEQSPTLNFPSSAGNLNIVVSLNLDPGNWIAVSHQASLGALLHFAVSPGDTDVPVNLALAPMSRISGRVVFEGTSRPPAATSVQVDVHGAGPDAALQSRTLTRAPVTPKADGTFDIADVIGTIVFGVAPLAGWTLKAVRYNGRDLLDDPLALKSGEDVAGVQVVLSDQVATLSGVAADSSGQPIAGCAVAVFPGEASPRFNSRRMRLARADQTGRFRLAAIPSGSYLAVAATDIDASIWLTPEFLERLRAGATPLTLDDREQKTITLSCTGAP